jgi:hypothetical protein
MSRSVTAISVRATSRSTSAAALRPAVRASVSISQSAMIVSTAFFRAS